MGNIMGGGWVRGRDVHREKSDSQFATRQA